MSVHNWKFLKVNTVMYANEWESLKLIFSDSCRSKLSTLTCSVGVYIYIWIGYPPFSTPTNQGK